MQKMRKSWSEDSTSFGYPERFVRSPPRREEKRNNEKEKRNARRH